MALVWLIVGLILGGGVSLIFLCALQLGRPDEYGSAQPGGETDRMK